MTTHIIRGIIGGFLVGLPLGFYHGHYNVWKDGRIISSGIDASGVGIMLVICISLGVIIAIVVGTIARRRNAVKEEEARRRSKIELAEHNRRRHLEEQEGYRERLVVLGEQALGIFESMPKHLESAEKWLDRAEADFSEGALAPFWDSVEQAAKCVARFHEGLGQIREKSSHYTQLVPKYEDVPPQFPLAPQSVERLGAGAATAKRMRAIVRNAQRNFQFAMIYEQRKTNQILISGFTTLAQVMEEMASAVTASIRDLVGSVEGMSSSLDDSMRAIHVRMDSIAESSKQHHKEHMRKASEIAAREARVVEILDSLKDRQQPSP